MTQNKLKQCERSWNKIARCPILRNVGFGRFIIGWSYVLINEIKEHFIEIETINYLLREENQHLRGENIQNKNNLKVEKTKNANNVKDLEAKIKKLQTELSEANRKSAGNITEINRLKNQINKDTDINGTLNIINVSMDEDINIRRNNGNDERLIDDFVDFKNFVTLEF